MKHELKVLNRLIAFGKFDFVHGSVIEYDNKNDGKIYRVEQIADDEGSIWIKASINGDVKKMVLVELRKVVA